MSEIPRRPELSTPSEIASLLRVSLKTVYYWVHRQEIPYLKIGRHLRFHGEAVLQAFVDKTNESGPTVYVTRRRPCTLVTELPATTYEACSRILLPQ